MNQIVLTPEQFNVCLAATGPVQFVDAKGNVAGTLDKTAAPQPTEVYFSQEEIEAIKKKRRENPNPKTYSGEHVRKLLAHLEETWQSKGPFDAKDLPALVRDFNEKEQP
jgi:hypothetical protein